MVCLLSNLNIVAEISSTETVLLVTPFPAGISKPPLAFPTSPASLCWESPVHTSNMFNSTFNSVCSFCSQFCVQSARRTGLLRGGHGRSSEQFRWCLCFCLHAVFPEVLIQVLMSLRAGYCWSFHSAEDVPTGDPLVRKAIPSWTVAKPREAPGLPLSHRKSSVWQAPRPPRGEATCSSSAVTLEASWW